MHRAPSTASPRTGSTRRASVGGKSGTGRHGLAAAAARVAARDRRPRRVPRLAALRPRRHRGVRLHAEGRRRWRCRRARPPSTSPTPCTPRSGTGPSVPASTGSSCRSSQGSTNGDVVEVFTSKAETAGPNRDWLTFVKSPRARNKIRPGSPRSAARRRSSPARSRSPERCASRGCRCSGCWPGERCRRSLADLQLPRHHRALRRGRRGARVGARHRPADRAGARRSRRGDRGPRRGHNPTRVSQGRARPQGDPGVVVKGDDDVWVKLATLLHPGAGRRRPRLRHPGHGVSVHRTDCVNVASLRQEPDRIVPVSGRRRRRACSWWRSRSRRSTARACCRT